MSTIGHPITKVEPGSIAEEMEIESGDVLISINNKLIKDVFDYHYLINDTYLTVVVRKQNGEEWELDIEKDYEEDLGIGFDEGLMDHYRSCKNKCIFCFIDQMPKGMRDTLYFKDDDARLSFLQGNYITLTNMSDEDIDRIINYKLMPINISVHTTNPDLRKKMLHNRFAGDALKKIKRLYEGGIDMNSQIVLCKGFNDGEELDRSIRELSEMLPYMQSLSVVPIGMTKYRDGLAQVEKFTREDARKVLDQIHGWQEKILKEHGTRFVFASDEWYILAGYEIPKEDYYEGYGQIENGVGMVRSLTDEVIEELKNHKGDERAKVVSLATGKLAHPIIESLGKKIEEKFPNIKTKVYLIENEFFGKDITVAGLLTGQDIIKQLKEQELGDYLILPSVLLRSGTDVLLDDLTVKDIETALQIPIRIVKSDGKSFVDTVID
ncbi:Fe-S oxidoreductase, related to NifB/MoaA family with PDZ N-terminal domain [Lachnospiraceae bacterium KM106-2]|nr:Fe-S oxidoreductase, related to NifB/MoaA family with PDZ N-terminal domain [Lachnospiraceae bacterium KM106-2]